MKLLYYFHTATQMLINLFLNVTASFGMIQPNISFCIHVSPKESQFAMRFSMGLSFESFLRWSDHICGSIEDSQYNDNTSDGIFYIFPHFK